MDMDTVMDVGGSAPPPQPQLSHAPSGSQPPSNQDFNSASNGMPSIVAATMQASLQARDPFRDISVKVHIRRPDKDSWTYLGRALVAQEQSRIVVRSAASRKIMTTFGEDAPLQAEKRGNFVVVGCIEGTRVVSWSFNAQNNSETLRLLASIELTCDSRRFSSNSSQQSSHRRLIARMIKDDRRKRHRRRKDTDNLVAALERTGLDSTPADQPMAAAEPVAVQQ
ncbi:uncharacterized protein B0H18DRAFT_968841 [Fomitopsis serialis]|uniref:uncharacterized protein n=1 Tax=Fomitopsis serialis TaxID=139415 RepID=UPI0020082B94|nr:uncharacterized protein B0H18DRAFT_968841 [Neoantrodia serialis]KAH9937032.1 hypothetical protein B0H18DRAFT_968841 [Neoantrodia serialis]